MATNRDLLKEAIADAKTVKNMAIANAKAALEESFTPQLTTMLSQKIQEMDELEEKEVCEECGGDHSSDTHMKESEEVEGLNEVDLEELLSELDEGEDTEEVKEEKEEEDDANEAEEDAEEAEDDADEAEDEALDLEDMTEDSLKKFIEDVIADMVDTGELEAGEGAEGEDIEGEEMEVEVGMEDEEEVNIDELIAEIDSLEEFGGMNPDSKGIFEDEDEELMTEDLKAWWERFKGSLGLGKLGEFNTAVLKWMQSNEQAIEDAKGNPQKGQDLLKRFTDEVESKMDRKAFVSDRSSLMKVLGISDKEGKTGHAGGGTYSESLQRENRILRSKLKEVKTTNKVLTSELNEINLLNSKLLYTNKIFKGKNLTESQKVKVLSTFDKATNVKEAKLIFETIKDSFKTTKKSINESYGSASRMLKSTNSKKPIIPVDDAFRRMQELAFYDKKH